MFTRLGIRAFVDMMEYLIDEGKEDKARQGIVRLLLNEKVGTDSPELRELAARLIAPRREGRPSKKRMRAQVVGFKNEMFKAGRIGPEPVRFELLGKQMNMSPSTVEREVTHYRKNKTSIKYGERPITRGEAVSTILEMMEIFMIAFPGREYETLATFDKAHMDLMPFAEALFKAEGKRNEFFAARDRLLAGVTKAPPKKP